MIEIDGIEYRNLEEQVQKNKEDIAAHYNVDRVLADFGIRVLGQKDSADQLPDPETFDGQYGDAYAVGESEPYSFYIWTRANPNDGHPTDYWFDIGPLAIVGPQGPIGLTGPQGPQGTRGSLWFSGNGIPSSAQNYNIGDQYLNAQNGDVYSLVTEGGSKRWMLQRNIMGPQGIQGPIGPQGLTGPQGSTGQKGDRGPAGPLVNILGALGNIDQLPNPTTLQRQSGYLIPIDGVYHVFIIIGNTNSLQWFDAGLFGAGTIIKENGNVLTEWDATNVMAPRLGNVPYYTGFAYQESDGSAELIPPDPLAVPFGGDFDPEWDGVRPVTRFVNGGIVAASWDYTTDIFNNIRNLAISNDDESIDEYPNDNDYYDYQYHTGMRDDQATPRCYVDGMDQKTFERATMYTDRTAVQKPITPEFSAEDLNNLLHLVGPAIPVLKADDNTGSVVNPQVKTVLQQFKVKCNIVNRTTKTFTLNPDKFYVIHGYGTNKVTIRKKDGSVLISDKNDILCMVSSSGSDGKTWHGFIAIGSGTLGVPAINWNGDLLDVGVYAENTSPSSDGGSGNMYVYEFGMFDYN